MDHQEEPTTYAWLFVWMPGLMATGISVCAWSYQGYVWLQTGASPQVNLADLATWLQPEFDLFYGWALASTITTDGMLDGSRVPWSGVGKMVYHGWLGRNLWWSAFVYFELMFAPVTLVWALVLAWQKRQPGNQ